MTAFTNAGRGRNTKAAHCEIARLWSRKPRKKSLYKMPLNETCDKARGVSSCSPPALHCATVKRIKSRCNTLLAYITF